MVKILNVWGRASHVGKTSLVAALCYYFSKKGLSVVPFKAQNMALNAMVGKENGEMAAAQVYQALACSKEPSVHMNPILLKPEDNSKSELIVQGKSFGSLNVREYYARKKEILAYVSSSFEKLGKNHDLIVVEGAGSCAEINLKHNDIANRFLFDIKRPPTGTLLVTDIERGGVFAQIMGTRRLLSNKERKGIMGVIINKFRGDKTLLDSGLEFIKNQTNWETLGIIPFLENLKTIEEDSLSLGTIFKKHGYSSFLDSSKEKKIKVGIVKFLKISNVTDFIPLKEDDRFSVRFIHDTKNFDDLDLAILPGTKMVGREISYLKNSGLGAGLLRFAQNDGWVLGLCGGFEVMCSKIEDDGRLENYNRVTKAMGLLPFKARIEKDGPKEVRNVHIVRIKPGLSLNIPVVGYEIHKAKIEGLTPEIAWFEVCFDNKEPSYEGVFLKDRKIMGTFIHGLFESSSFRDYIYGLIKGKTDFSVTPRIEFKDILLENLKRLCLTLESNVNMETIEKGLGL